MSLSIIIPTLDIDNLMILFKSMQNFNRFNNSYEILVINQSNKNVFDLTNQYNLKILDNLIDQLQLYEENHSIQV